MSKGTDGVSEAQRAAQEILKLSLINSSAGINRAAAIIDREMSAASADVRELRKALQAIATSGKSLTMGDVREIARAVLKKHGAGTL